MTAPTALFATLAAHPRPALGLGAILVLAAPWSVLSLLLAAGGHRPAVGAPVVPAASHYLVQAMVLPLVLALAWLGCAAVAGAVARGLGGTPAGPALRATLGLACAVPLALLLVVPDLVVLLLFGHAALAPAMRWYAPAALVWAAGLATLAVRASSGLGGWRAIAAATAGLVTAILLLAVVVR